jgi:tetratricopeptide (TPR) repeat protein
LFFSDTWDAEHDRQRVQLAREAVAFDPNFVLAWDALATSLGDLAARVDGAQADRLRAEAAQIRVRIAQLAPDHWSVKRERAYSLWREGKRAEAIAVAREIMDSGPLTYEHAVPYANLIFAAGHLDEAVAVDEQFRTIEPLAMFHSRSLQFDYIAARRYDEAEAEYRRSLALEGSHVWPAGVAFERMLAQEDADLEAQRELHRQLVQDFGDRVPPYFRDLGAVLHDRDAMLAILHHAAADPVYRGDYELFFLADALGDTDLAAASMRESMEGRKGFKEGHMPYFSYFELWTAPYSGLRAHPEFKKLLIETGLADYWRQTGKWGDGCKPLGADDFQCK